MSILKRKTSDEDQTAWKIGKGPRGSIRLIELLIPKDARRTSVHISSKYRTERAKVVNIFDVDTDLGRIIESGRYSESFQIKNIEIDYSREYDVAYSALAPSLGGEKEEYRVGETIEIDDYEDGIFSSNRCGIYFFFSKDKLFDFVESELFARKKRRQIPPKSVYNNSKRHKNWLPPSNRIH